MPLPNFIEVLDGDGNKVRFGVLTDASSHFAYGITLLDADGEPVIPSGGGLAVADNGSHTSLAAIVTALAGTLAVSDASALTELTAIAASLAGTVATGDSTSHTSLAAIAASLAGTLATADATTHTTLAAIAASLAGTVAVADSAAETALTAILAKLNGTLAVTDAAAEASLAALQALIAQGAPVSTVTPLAVGTAAAAGRKFVVNSTAIGTVTVTLSGGQSRTYPVGVGLTVFPLAVTEVTAQANTGTVTYENWN